MAMRLDPNRLKQLCWGCAVVSALLHIAPFGSCFADILDDPWSVLRVTVACLIFPTIPFLVLIGHVNMRARPDNSLPAPVSVSVVVSAVVTLLFTVWFFFWHVLPEEWGILWVFILPFVTVPVAAGLCFTVWVVAVLVLTRRPAGWSTRTCPPWRRMRRAGQPG